MKILTTAYFVSGHVKTLHLGLSSLNISFQVELTQAQPWCQGCPVPVHEGALGSESAPQSNDSHSGGCWPSYQHSKPTFYLIEIKFN